MDDAPKGKLPRWMWTAIKMAAAVAILAALFWKITSREGIDVFRERLSNLAWPWVVAAFGVQITAIACSVLRWRILLRGQGIRAPLPHLIGAFMTGRFFGIVAPGGWTGLDAFRIYDISSRTGKTARATATIVVDKLIGWGCFGTTLVVGSIFGWRTLGPVGVLIVDGLFLGLIGFVIALLVKPRLVRAMARRLPQKARARLSTMVDAVCAYEGKTAIILTSAALSIGTHALTNVIYVCSARALGAAVAAGDVFFVSAMQILATFAPLTPNGIGIREAVAGHLYDQIGVVGSEAVLIPIVGFLVDAIVSACGGVFLLTRGAKYRPSIEVEDGAREAVADSMIPRAPMANWPRRKRGAVLGAGAGLLAGVMLGLTEGAVTLLGAAGRAEWTVLAYGGVAYGILGAAGGAALGFVLAWIGRVMEREAYPEPVAFSRFVALMFAVPAFAIGAFRVRRDLFDEELVWKSGKGLLVGLSCLAIAGIAYVALTWKIRKLVNLRAFSWVLRPWGAPVFAIGMGVLVTGVAFAFEPPPAPTADLTRRAPAPAQAGPLIVLVVDTLRADALYTYGYTKGHTPNLDAFARDAIRFDQAFANASWTRPSFATILTGRYPSSHAVMGKASALPDAVTTWPEALRDQGFVTGGIVTNYNVAPYFNFQQGFDAYRYLEPDFVLGANDTAAKLLFIQFARQTIEKLEEKISGTRPGRAYRDAETVNRAVFSWLNDAPADRPFFLFVGYMDPHDPYFPHPYARGGGYSRAAHQTPDPRDAERLRALYDGEVTYWDEHFGALVAELRRRDLYDRSTIVVTADHGEEFAEHGGFWHGTTLYDEQIRIPLFIKLPMNERGGQVERQWVEHVDVMPTLLTRMGVPVPEGVQGGDLFAGRSRVFAEESHEGNVLSSMRIRRGMSELKIIRANAGNPRGLEAEELYRVDMDPSEQVNLAGELPHEARLAEAALAEGATHANQGAVRGSDVNLGDATERLGALGYVTTERKDGGQSR